MKRKSLLLLSDQKLVDLYILNLQGYLESEVIHFKTLDETLIRIEQDRKIDLIVTVGQVGQNYYAEEVCRQIVTESMRTPVVCLGLDDIESLKKSYKSLQIENNTQADDIRSTIGLAMKVLNISKQDLSQVPKSDYFPIPLKHLYILERSVCDIYMRIGSGEKYLKRVNEGSGLDSPVLDRYASYGALNLFVEMSNRLSFINDITQKLIGNIEGIDIEKKIQGEQVALELIQNNIDDLANPEIVKVAKTLLSSLVKDSKGYPKVSKLLSNMLHNKTSLTYKHTKLNSYFALSILKEMDWAKKEQVDAMAFLAMFHDISLDRDELVMIDSKEELYKSDLNEQDKELVNNHALESAGLIGTYPKAPMGVATLMKQHHGVLNGIGFSESYSGNLSPMVVIFIVAEHSSHYVLKNLAKEYSSENLIKYLREKFSTNRFKRMIEALEKVI